jgi:hypothetical protein
MVQAKELKRLELCAAIFAITITFVTFINSVCAPPINDEVEFLHAAWLMQHGERLFIDFFEHHSPLFFELLARGFYPDVVRNVVLVRLTCTFSFILSAILFSFVFSEEGAADAPGLTRTRRLIFYIVFVVLLWLCATNEIRPETFAVLSLTLSVFISRWISNPKPLWKATVLFTSILCLGFAVAFSPRMIVPAAAVVFWIFYRIDHSWASWGTAALATLLAGAAVITTMLMTASYSDISFWYLTFSRLMLPINRSLPTYDPSVLIRLLALGIIALRLSLIAVIFCSVVRGSDRFSTTMLALTTPRLMIFELLLALSLIALYLEHRWFPQSLVPIALVEALWSGTVVWIVIREAVLRKNVFRIRLAQSVFVIVALGVIVGSSAQALLRSGVSPNFDLVSPGTTTEMTASELKKLDPDQATNLFDWSRRVRAVCSILSNDLGLFSTWDHPVCVKDASYYWYGAHLVNETHNYYRHFLPTRIPNLKADIVSLRPLAISKSFVIQNRVDDRELGTYVASYYDDDGWIWLRRNLH